MTEETIHESRRRRSRQAIATYFQRLSNRLRRGEPVPANDEQTVTVNPADHPEMEIELEREDGNVSLEIELEWEEEEGDVDTDAQASKATFQRYQDSADQWRWRLRHNNGNIIADGGEGYASKQKVTQGLESVKKNAPGAHVVDLSREESVEDTDEGDSNAAFEVYKDTGDKWRWRLVHDNGNIIADCGEGYASKQKAKQGLQSVKTNAPGATVEDES